MLECWNPDGAQRPPFHMLGATLRQIISDMEQSAAEQQHEQAAPVIYSNVPTSQSYLYPTTQSTYERRSRGFSSSSSASRDQSTSSSRDVNTSQSPPRLVSRAVSHDETPREDHPLFVQRTLSHDETHHGSKAQPRVPLSPTRGAGQPLLDDEYYQSRVMMPQPPTLPPAGVTSSRSPPPTSPMALSPSSLGGPPFLAANESSSSMRYSPRALPHKNSFKRRTNDEPHLPSSASSSSVQQQPRVVLSEHVSSPPSAQSAHVSSNNGGIYDGRSMML